MRVCLDIQSAIAQRAGVGRYTKMLAEHLAPLRGGDDLVLFFFDFQRRGMPFPVPEATPTCCRWVPGRLAQGAWKTVGWPPFDAFSGPADVYHFPNFVRPPLTKGRSIVTVHDLAFLRFPDTIEQGNFRHLTARIRQTVEQADVIIAVSEFTAREIRDLLRVPAERIAAIHSGIEQFRQAPDETDAVAARRLLQLDRPYLLCVSTLEPRKNFPLLVDTFDRLPFDGDLVIAGGRGWKYEPILDRIRASPKSARIRCLEYVDDALLPGLYAGAELFVFPSLYEGFGFTPLEAMSFGTPVVSSSGGSLPEVLGDAAEIVDSFDADAWVARIQALLGDADRRRALRAAGRERARRYSWEQTARRTWDVYRRIA
jgi:glycosyltransferase involved in cell wall biosynthesis